MSSQWELKNKVDLHPVVSSPYFLDDTAQNHLSLVQFHRVPDGEVFILWSGDSDFSDPVKRLLEAGRKVVVFATARKVSRELSDLREKGLVIFDIQKIRNLICWNKEIQSKGDIS